MATFYQDAMTHIEVAESVLHKLYKKLGKKGSHAILTPDLIEQKGGTKSDLSAFLFDVVNSTLDCVRVLKSGCLEVDALKSEAKTAYKDLAEIQQELLTSKREQIDMFQTGVQETLKNEIKTYSDAVKKSCGDSLTLKKIKTVVKDVVEDRSKNLMIFGLGEVEGENLNSEVENVFTTLGEKPKFEAERVGIVDGIKCRAVKVVLRNRSSVFDLLKKSKDLKNHKKMEKVFLQPDRTFEERLQHRKLVSELKQSAEEMPANRFFIRKGKVCSEPKRQVVPPTTPKGPRSPSEAVIMRLKAAGKPIPPELYNRTSRRTKQKSSSEESDSDY